MVGPYIDRREFFAGACRLGTGFVGLKHFVSRVAAGTGGADRASPQSHPLNEVPGYGPLTRDPLGILDLPKGFSYRVLSRTGEFMSDGLRIPGMPDGMAAFSGGLGKTILLRNHELERTDVFNSAYGLGNALLRRVGKARFYDLADDVLPHLGGVSTVVYDHFSGRVEKQFMSLAGTLRNCAGGPTPWGSWITCEETVEKKGSDSNRQDHGYNFEVPASMEARLYEPVPLKAMGRFRHEAVAVDARSGVVYQTEDLADGLIYRFLPNEPSRLSRGGRLQALKISERPQCDTRNWKPEQGEEASPGFMPFEENRRFQTEWLDLDEVDSPEDDLRLRGREKGAAVFARGEGMWAGHGYVYWACTNGGAEKRGQVFRYRPSPNEGGPLESGNPGELELFVESKDAAMLEFCDNLTVAPWGDVVLSEDGPEVQYLRVISPHGKLFTLGRNRLNKSEMAGCCFAPDHPTLFVNIQRPGMTLAITGPWMRRST